MTNRTSVAIPRAEKEVVLKEPVSFIKYLSGFFDFGVVYLKGLLAAVTILGFNIVGIFGVYALMVLIAATVYHWTQQ